MIKNEEKQILTHFGLLPLEIGVSCLTDVSMGKSAQFPIEPCCRELLGRRGARDLIFVDFGPFQA